MSLWLRAVVFVCAAALVLAILSFGGWQPAVAVVEPAAGTSSNSNAAANAMPQQNENENEGANYKPHYVAASAQVVAKLTLPCFACSPSLSQAQASRLGQSMLSVLGTEGLKTDDVVLVKGGRGAYAAATPESNRENEILPTVKGPAGALGPYSQHVNHTNEPNVARALARCYRVVNVTGECSPQNATALRFLRLPGAYSPSTEKLACKNKACSVGSRCVARTACPVQVEFDFDPVDVQPYGQGLFSYASGYPVLAPLDEGKWASAVWQSGGGWRAFYGSVHNFSYEYDKNGKRGRFYDERLKSGGPVKAWGQSGKQHKLDLKLEGWDSWSFQCKYGGSFGDGTGCARSYGRGYNEHQIAMAHASTKYGSSGYDWLATDRRTGGTKWKESPAGCKVCNLAKDVINDQGQDSLSSEQQKLRVLSDKHFHSMEWAGTNARTGHGADIRCTGWHFGRGWKQAYKHQSNNKQGIGLVGAYPMLVRGAARESVRADEQLTVCNIYKECTGRILAERKRTGKAVHPVNERLVEWEGGWAYTQRGYAKKCKMLVTDTDGRLLTKVPAGEEVDLRRFPFGSSLGPAHMAPELTWEPRMDEDGQPGGGVNSMYTCNEVCHAAGKYCVDLHELDDALLKTGFVAGGRVVATDDGGAATKREPWSLESIAQATRHVRCDEYADQVWASSLDGKPQPQPKASCLCGNLAAPLNVVVRQFPAQAEAKTCDALCGDGGAKCLNMSEVTHGARSQVKLKLAGEEPAACHTPSAQATTCLCTAPGLPPGGERQVNRNGGTGGTNQWFLSAAKGYEYRSRRTGVCYHLSRDCVGDSATCVTGPEAPAHQVQCRGAKSGQRAQWATTVSAAPRLHPVPHAFAQDPDALVSHAFWSDITVARTDDDPARARAGGRLSGGIGGGCGATYTFAGSKRHVYVGSSAGAGSMSVGNRALDTRTRYTCPYNYTSRGTDSRVSQAELLGSNRKWKAWWGLTAEVDASRPCYEHMTVRRGWGRHVWAESVGVQGGKRTCRMYYDATKQVSGADGTSLTLAELNRSKSPLFVRDDGRWLGTDRELWPLAKTKAHASEQLRQQPYELVLYDEDTPYDVRIGWHNSKSCLERCHEGEGSGPMDTKHGASGMHADDPDGKSIGTCAYAYDARGVLAPSNVELSCELLAEDTPATRSTSGKQTKLRSAGTVLESGRRTGFDAAGHWRVFYGDEGVLYRNIESMDQIKKKLDIRDGHPTPGTRYNDIMTWPADLRQKYVDIVCIMYGMNFGWDYEKVYGKIPRRLYGGEYVPGHAGYPNYGIAACRRYREVTDYFNKLVRRGDKQVSLDRRTLEQGGRPAKVGLWHHYGWEDDSAWQKRPFDNGGQWGISGRNNEPIRMVPENEYRRRLVFASEPPGASSRIELYPRSNDDKSTCRARCEALGGKTCVDYNAIDNEAVFDQLGGRASVRAATAGLSCDVGGTRVAQSCLCEGPVDATNVAAVYEACDPQNYRDDDINRSCVLSLQHWPFRSRYDLLPPKPDLLPRRKELCWSGMKYQQAAGSWPAGASKCVNVTDYNKRCTKAEAYAECERLESCKAVTVFTIASQGRWWEAWTVRGSQSLYSQSGAHTYLKTYSRGGCWPNLPAKQAFAGSLGTVYYPPKWPYMNFTGMGSNMRKSSAPEAVGAPVASADGPFFTTGDLGTYDVHGDGKTNFPVQHVAFYNAKADKDKAFTCERLCRNKGMFCLGRNEVDQDAAPPPGSYPLAEYCNLPATSTKNLTCACASATPQLSIPQTASQGAYVPDIRCKCARRLEAGVDGKDAAITRRIESEYFDGLSDPGLREWAAKQKARTVAQAGVACTAAAAVMKADEPLPALSEWHWQTARCAQDHPANAMHWAVPGSFRGEGKTPWKAEAANDAFQANAPYASCACARHFGYTPNEVGDSKRSCTISTGSGRDRRTPICGPDGGRQLQDPDRADGLELPAQWLQGKGRFRRWAADFANQAAASDWFEPTGDGGGNRSSSYFCCSSQARYAGKTPSEWRAVWEDDILRDALHARDVICHAHFDAVVGAANVFASPRGKGAVIAKYWQEEGWETMRVPTADPASTMHSAYVCVVGAQQHAAVGGIVDRPVPGLATARAVAVADTNTVPPTPPSGKDPLSAASPWAFEIRISPTEAQRAHYGSGGSKVRRLRVCRVVVSRRDTSEAHDTAAALSYLEDMEPTGMTGVYERVHKRAAAQLSPDVLRKWKLDTAPTADGEGLGTSIVVSVDYTYGGPETCREWLADKTKDGVLVGLKVRGPSSGLYGRTKTGAAAADDYDYDAHNDAIGAAYTLPTAGLTPLEKHNLHLYQRAGVLRAHGHNFQLAKAAAAGSSRDERRRAGTNDVDLPGAAAGAGGNTEVWACGRGAVYDPVVRQNAGRWASVSSFHAQVLARRVVTNEYVVPRDGKVRRSFDGMPRHAHQMYLRQPRTLAYDYMEGNPVIDVAYAYKTWGFYETTPCRPGGTGGEVPAACAVGSASAEERDKFKYNEFARARDGGCMLYNGCNSVASYGDPSNSDYFSTRASPIKSFWAASLLGGKAVNRQGAIENLDHYTGKDGSAELGLDQLGITQYETWWRAPQARATGDRRTAAARESGTYYPAPMHDRLSHRFCGLTIGPPMLKPPPVKGPSHALTAGYGQKNDKIVIDGGGRQYDIAACQRFDTCQAPVVFAASGKRERQPNSDALQVQQLSAQKASLFAACGGKTYVQPRESAVRDIEKDVAQGKVVSLSRWIAFANKAAHQAPPYAAMLVREEDVLIRAAAVFGGAPTRDALMAPRSEGSPPCGESMSCKYRGSLAGGVLGGAFRCDTSWLVDVGSGVADAPHTVQRFGSAARPEGQGSVDDEVNTCATTGARYQVPRHRPGKWGAQTRTTDAEPVLTLMPACAATLRDLTDYETGYYYGGPFASALAGGGDVLGPAKRPYQDYETGSKHNIHVGQLGWAGYGVGEWADQRIARAAGQRQPSTAISADHVLYGSPFCATDADCISGVCNTTHVKPRCEPVRNTVYRGAFYDFEATAGEALSYGGGEGRVLSAYARYSFANANLASLKGNKDLSDLRSKDDSVARLVLGNGGWVGSAIYQRPSGQTNDDDNQDAKASYWVRARVADSRYYSSSGGEQGQQNSSNSAIRTYTGISKAPTARLKRLIADGGVQDPGVKSGAALPYFDKVSRSTVWFQHAPDLPASGSNPSTSTKRTWRDAEVLPGTQLTLSQVDPSAGWVRRWSAGSKDVVPGQFAKLHRRYTPKITYATINKATKPPDNLCRSVRAMLDTQGVRVVATADGLRRAGADGGGCGCSVLGTTNVTGITLRADFADVVPLTCGTPFIVETEDANAKLGPLAVPPATSSVSVSTAIAGSTGPGDGMPIAHEDPESTRAPLVEVYAVSARSGSGTAFAIPVGDCLHPLEAPPGFIVSSAAKTTTERKRPTTKAEKKKEGTTLAAAAYSADLVVTAMACLADAGCAGLQQKSDETTSEPPQYRLTADVTVAKFVKADQPKSEEEVNAGGGFYAHVVDARDLAPVLRTMTFEQKLAASRKAASPDDSKQTKAMAWPRLFKREAYLRRDQLSSLELQHDPVELTGLPLDLISGGCGAASTKEDDESWPSAHMRTYKRLVMEASVAELDRLATVHEAMSDDARTDRVVRTGTWIANVQNTQTCNVACAKAGKVCAALASVPPSRRQTGWDAHTPYWPCDSTHIEMYQEKRGTHSCFCATETEVDSSVPLDDASIVGKMCEADRDCAACHDGKSFGCCQPDAAVMASGLAAGRCALRTRMHVPDLPVGYMGGIGKGVPYAFAREAAGWHRVLGSAAESSRPQVYFETASGDDVTADVRAWLATDKEGKGSGETWSHSTLDLVVRWPDVPEKYRESVGIGLSRGKLSRAAADLQQRAQTTYFCAAEGGRCHVRDSDDVVRFGTAAQLLSKPGSELLGLRKHADANWEFGATCRCPNGAQAGVGLPKTAAWSVSAQGWSAAKAQFEFSRPIVRSHHADISYGGYGYRIERKPGEQYSERVLELSSFTAKGEDDPGRGPWFSERQIVYDALVHSVHGTATTWAAYAKDAAKRKEEGLALATSKHMQYTHSGEGSFCAGGKLVGFTRAPPPPSDAAFYASDRRIVQPPEAPNGTKGQVRLGVGAQCLGTRLPSATSTSAQNYVNCEPAAFPAAQERGTGLGPTRYCAFTRDRRDQALAAAVPSAVDALTAIAHGRVSVVAVAAVSPAAGGLFVEVAEAPAHSFNQAYLQQVWRHHAWRHGAGTLSGMAAAEESGTASLPPMLFHFEQRERLGPDPRVDGDEAAIKSMYRRLPRAQRTPNPDTEPRQCEQGYPDEPVSGLSHYWRMFRADDVDDKAAVKRMQQHAVVETSSKATAQIGMSACRAMYQPAAGSQNVRAVAVARSAALADAHDTWAEMQCGRSHFELVAGYRELRVPGAEDGDVINATLDAADLGSAQAPVRATLKLRRGVHDIGGERYHAVREGLNKARVAREAALMPNMVHTKDSIALRSDRLLVQGYQMRKADAQDAAGFYGTAILSGHRTGKYELYNETEAKINVTSAVASATSRVRPPLAHFGPLRRDHKEAMRGCCLGQYDDAQVASWGVTTLKPVYNALHPGWSTMGTFVMPRNGRGSFFCGPMLNAAADEDRSGGKEPATGEEAATCAKYLHEECYETAHFECAPLQSRVHDYKDLAWTKHGPRATPKTSNAAPTACKGMFALDPALRTACRAHTRSRLNWVKSSKAMREYCEYTDTALDEKGRQRARDNPDDPRRTQCMSWCAWFCRLDTPRFGLGTNQRTAATGAQFMCNPRMSDNGTPQGAGGWCEQYMWGTDTSSINAELSGGAKRRADYYKGQTKYTGGKYNTKTKEWEGGAVAQTYGACRVDQAQNDRLTDACSCVQRSYDVRQGVHESRADAKALQYQLCHDPCALHGHAQYSAKTTACPRCMADAQLDIDELEMAEGAQLNVDMQTKACGSTTERCYRYNNSIANWLNTCHSASSAPADIKDGSGLLHSPQTALCERMIGIGGADALWVQSVIFNGGSDAQGMAARKITQAEHDAQQGGGLVEERAKSVLCFRHNGKYRCTAAGTVPVIDETDEVAAARAVWIAPRRVDDVGTAAIIAPDDSKGLLECAANCTFDAVSGPEDAGVLERGEPAELRDAQTSRCIGFRFGLSGDKEAGAGPQCELYGAWAKGSGYSEKARIPTAHVQVGDQVVGYGTTLQESGGTPVGGKACAIACSSVSKELESDCVQKTFSQAVVNTSTSSSKKEEEEYTTTDRAAAGTDKAASGAVPPATDDDSDDDSDSDDYNTDDTLLAGAYIAAGALLAYVLFWLSSRRRSKAQDIT